MKTLRLLNKRYFSIILVLFIGFNVFAEEQPVDIWNIDKKEIENNSSISTSNNENNLKNKSEPTSNIYDIYCIIYVHQANINPYIILFIMAC